MSAVVSSTTVGQFEAIALENAHVRAVILPTLGGRVWELDDRTSRHQWIWHRPDVSLNASPMGAVYEDVWAGGWEELFPNDAPGTFAGRSLPDHGEWWTMRWEACELSSGTSARVRLSASSTVIKASCTKEFSLDSAASTVSVSYRIRSEEPEPFHFLFKQHLPVQLDPGCRLLLPGGRVHPVDASFSTLATGPAPFDWPMAPASNGQAVDLSWVQPRTERTKEFVYVSDMPASWCGVEHPDGASIRMDFDSQTLPFVWLFLTYGGWRDLYTAVLEPCSNMPKDLAQAARLGQSARLEPGEEFKTTVKVTLAGSTGATR
jgi:hypothetical protein